MDANTENRMEALEVRLAFQDELLDALNATVARQQKEIDLLQQQIRLLYQQFRSAQPDDAAGGSLRDEIPPHY
ncbi:SlyX protein [Chromobacterium paludis]|uniref:Protein SlyX homolog n=2 Tax=Chromobacterium paludis TaxID=2605945 RepID=A0A5C1DLU2_9NEIS|nr:SlyX protein [Chromobacterium paludis]